MLTCCSPLTVAQTRARENSEKARVLQEENKSLKSQLHELQQQSVSAVRNGIVVR